MKKADRTGAGGRKAEIGRLFSGDSEMAARMRALDWSKTAAGPVSRWPESLKTAVRIVLNSRYPMFIWWGPRALTYFYNDAYVPVLGAKHPRALGRSGAEVWPEIWKDLGPLSDAVFKEGRASWSEEMPLFMERSGYREETFFTFSYSPILESDGSVGGLFCACSEDTKRVISERRLRTQRAVAGEVVAARDVDEACTKAAGHLATNPRDVPFGLLYLLDDEGMTARLVASSGLDAESRLRAEAIVLGSDADVWDFAAGTRTGASHVVTSVPRAFIGAVPRGAWEEPPTQALVAPLARPGYDVLAGFAVLGVSPRRVFDDDYRGFCDLIAGHVATGIMNARAYAEERKRVEALAELDRAKTAFFSNVSHEFRTPLTLLLGPLEDALAGADEVLGPRNTERLDIAQRNGLRLLRLVNSLLDFSRIEAGRMQAAYDETDIGTFTEELASVFRSAIERAGLTLQVSCEPVERAVYVDREMWEKVVLNLLSNAFKFTPRGQIVVTVRDLGERVALSVRDTGTGIPAHELPHLFERFHRVRGAQGRTQEGTGIGLALVQELVKLHGGAVTVESDLGRGSTFTVTLPTGCDHLPRERVGGGGPASTPRGAAPYVEEALRWLPDEAAGPLRPDDVQAAALRVSTAGARVLLADDNADMRKYLQRLLAVHWQVEAVADGEEALAAIHRAPPDVVLSDVMMPKLDGFGLVKAIRDDPATRTLPVILLSARAGEESRVEGLNARADDYLVKPFSAREIVARVNAHLELALVRKEAQSAIAALNDTLATSVRELEAVLETTPVGIWFARDPQCRVVRGNRAAETLLGVFPGNVSANAPGAARVATYRRFGREVSPDDLPLQKAIAAKTTVLGDELEIERADGRRITLVVNAAPLLAADGSVRGAVAAGVDVTEREQLLAVAEGARAEAECANHAKDEFLAVVSHELRSPMNAMLGWLRILKSSAVRDPDLVARAVDTFERNIWIQAQVINDLLDVSRILSGKLQLEQERVELAGVVTGCVESLRPSAEGKQVALRLDLKDADLEVIGDGARLQQVVANLLGNAIKFTDPGGFVTVTVERREGAACLAVADTGQGISPEFVPHLFERFRQADSGTSRRHGGLGLGLSIVKNLVALHGGAVHAESAGAGRGARFSVQLPLADARHRVAFKPSAPARVDDDAGLRALDVLVVEDDADTRHALEVALEDQGSRVRVTATVRQALDAYNARPPDVLLSDIGMAGEDGYTLIRAIREREEGRDHRTLAIAMTGFAGPQDRAFALRAGFDEHVAKPVDPEVLFERLRVLAASRGDRER